VTESDVANLLKQAGERWCQRASAPPTAEETARARRAVRQALAALHTAPPTGLREQIAALLHVAVDRLHSVGVLPASRLAWTPGLVAAAAPEHSWSQTARSDDDRLLGTLLVTEEDEVWLSVETHDPAMDGMTVAFAIVSIPDRDVDRDVMSGNVRLQPAGRLWEGRQLLGQRRDLGIRSDCELLFAAVEVQK
jgi:hypothetical protein